MDTLRPSDSEVISSYGGPTICLHKGRVTVARARLPNPETVNLQVSQTWLHCYHRLFESLCYCRSSNVRRLIQKALSASAYNLLRRRLSKFNTSLRASSYDTYRREYHFHIQRGVGYRCLSELQVLVLRFVDECFHTTYQLCVLQPEHYISVIKLYTRVLLALLLILFALSATC